MDRLCSRRAALAAAAAALAGCAGGSDGTGTGTTVEPDGTSTGTDVPVLGAVEERGGLRLSSPAFADGGAIPDRFARDGANVNPPLVAEDVPEDAASLTVVVDDPDAVGPAGEVWLHWLVWDVPPGRTEIPADWSPEAAVVGENDFGNRRYDGPDPPDGTHTYRFKCFATDRALDLPPSATDREVGAAMAGTVLAAAELSGTYGPD